MLREDFMPDCGLTTAKLAESLGVSRQTINEILRERRAMTSLMACDWPVCSETPQNNPSMVRKTVFISYLTFTTII